jgi:hypothetical protein
MWPLFIFAIVLAILGVVVIVIRRQIIRFVTYQRSLFLGNSARPLGIRSSPWYYIVIGSVLLLFAVIFGLGAWPL